MRTLSLFRHAKSSRDDPSLDDFDRPLAERGVRDAPRIGRYIAEHNLIPDLILCSGSERTRETLKLAWADWSARPETVYDDALYHAPLPVLFAKLRELPNRKRHIMMVGHNPGTHSFAQQLVGSGAEADVNNLVRKFPSGALAVITFDVERWREIILGGGHLSVFVTPKGLQAEA